MLIQKRSKKGASEPKNENSQGPNVSFLEYTGKTVHLVIVKSVEMFSFIIIAKAGYPSTS